MVSIGKRITVENKYSWLVTMKKTDVIGMVETVAEPCVVKEFTQKDGVT